MGLLKYEAELFIYHAFKMTDPPSPEFSILYMNDQSEMPARQRMHCAWTNFDYLIDLSPSLFLTSSAPASVPLTKPGQSAVNYKLHSLVKMLRNQNVTGIR